MTLSTLASNEHEDAGAPWRVTRGFFAVALSTFAVDFVYLFQSGRQPNAFACCAALFAIVGLSLLRTARAAERRGETHDLPAYLSAEALSTFAVFTAFLALYAATGWVDPSPYNAHVRQAVAFLHGHAYIDSPDLGAIEHVVFGGHSYQLHPPLPAILLMPFAAIWGLETNQTIFSLIFGTLNVVVAWWLLGHLNLSNSARTWLTVFFGAGTTMWFETINAGSWDVSQVVAVGFTLAALGEVFGRGRPLVVGVLAGLAALSRYDLAPEFPIYAALLLVRGKTLRELLWMTPGIALSGIVLVTLNEVRYRDLFDITLLLMAGNQPLFATEYFPSNIKTLLYLAPNFNDAFPYMHPQFAGQALTFTSPAFVLALRPGFRKITSILLGIGALLAIIPSLFFLWNGSAQVGTRHYLHSFPFLLVLMALGVPRRADWLTRTLIVISLTLVSFTVWHMREWGFG